MQTVLVANRGEIALRVFRAARALGLRTVAVVAPDDAGSLHARSADQTVEIGSYLHAEEHIRAALQSGADAVHPGYGFLAESADFAEAVEAAGLTWIGPPPDALRRAATSSRQSGSRPPPACRRCPEAGRAAADREGGRGRRRPRHARRPHRRELAPALEAARREAQAGFGDDRVYLERYLERPRHVEIQLLADAHGTVLSLGERECSVQRRHQKVLEESPSTALDPELRARMSDAAVRFAPAIGYVGAGTAEFVLDGGEFFFLELNGRIQVEHPVTEAVTGVDLVQWQLRIARGEKLELEVQQRGAAVEVRLYAEDPRTFLPQTGTRRAPAAAVVDPCRERGVAEGDEVGIAYDPMIAKLIASGATRDEAFDRLAAALAETEVVGVTTNLPFLRWLVAHPAVRAGETTTAFLTEYPPLSAPPRALPRRRVARRLPAQPAAAPLAPPPDLDSLAARSQRRRRRAAHRGRADAGHRDQRQRS